MTKADRGQSSVEAIRTEDGVEVKVGDLAYDYYSMKPGRIEAFDLDVPREDVYHSRLMQGSIMPWFRFRHNDGGGQYLNGQRICSIEAAIREGYPGAQEAHDKEAEGR